MSESKTVVFIEIGENLAELFTTAIQEASGMGESIYNIVDVLSSRIESMANTAVLNNVDNVDDAD